MNTAQCKVAICQIKYHHVAQTKRAFFSWKYLQFRRLSAEDKWNFATCQPLYALFKCWYRTLADCSRYPASIAPSRFSKPFIGLRFVMLQRLDYVYAYAISLIYQMTTNTLYGNFNFICCGIDALNTSISNYSILCMREIERAGEKKYTFNFPDVSTIDVLRMYNLR